VVETFNPVCPACRWRNIGVAFTQAQREGREPHPIGALLRCRRCGASYQVADARWRVEPCGVAARRA
jgi:hypothetical protein